MRVEHAWTPKRHHLLPVKLNLILWIFISFYIKKTPDCSLAQPPLGLPMPQLTFFSLNSCSPYKLLMLNCFSAYVLEFLLATKSSWFGKVFWIQGQSTLNISHGWWVLLPFQVGAGEYLCHSSGCTFWERPSTTPSSHSNLLGTATLGSWEGTCSPAVQCWEDLTTYSRYWVEGLSCSEPGKLLSFHLVPVRPPRHRAVSKRPAPHQGIVTKATAPCWGHHPLPPETASAAWIPSWEAARITPGCCLPSPAPGRWDSWREQQLKKMKLSLWRSCPASGCPSPVCLASRTHEGYSGTWAPHTAAMQTPCSVEMASQSWAGPLLAHCATRSWATNLFSFLFFYFLPFFLGCEAKCKWNILSFG